MAEAPPLTPCVVDNVVLAMFVDADYATLLLSLAAGSVYLTPSIVDSHEHPPFVDPPVSEFSKGLYEAQQDLGDPFMARRAQRRTAFYAAQAVGLWYPVDLSETELGLAGMLTSREIRDAARQMDPTFKTLRIDPGEAECAAVAIERGWTLWSDDHAIVTLVRTLYPQCRVERLCGLLVRAVDEGLIDCAEAQYLYNHVFKGELNLWSKLSLDCVDQMAICRHL